PFNKRHEPETRAIKRVLIAAGSLLISGTSQRLAPSGFAMPKYNKNWGKILSNVCGLSAFDCQLIIISKPS
ncbi:MAG: hypothetical protein EAZ50_09430, partial [Runella slithyformis]